LKSTETLFAEPPSLQNSIERHLHVSLSRESRRRRGRTGEGGRQCRSDHQEHRAGKERNAQHRNNFISVGPDSGQANRSDQRFAFVVEHLAGDRLGQNDGGRRPMAVARPAIDAIGDPTQQLLALDDVDRLIVGVFDVASGTVDRGAMFRCSRRVLDRRRGTMIVRRCEIRFVHENLH